jgi:hypothetical protein
LRKHSVGGGSERQPVVQVAPFQDGAGDHRGGESVRQLAVPWIVNALLVTDRPAPAALVHTEQRSHAHEFATILIKIACARDEHIAPICVQLLRVRGARHIPHRAIG